MDTTVADGLLDLVYRLIIGLANPERSAMGDRIKRPSYSQNTGTQEFCLLYNI